MPFSTAYINRRSVVLQVLLFSALTVVNEAAACFCLSLVSGVWIGLRLRVVSCFCAALGSLIEKTCQQICVQCG